MTIICLFDADMGLSSIMRLPSYRVAALSVVRKSYRLYATTRNPSAVYMDLAKQNAIAVAQTPDNMTPEQRDVLDKALRVDQAGEVAANWIYRGQMAILGRDTTSGPLIQVC